MEDGTPLHDIIAACVLMLALRLWSDAFRVVVLTGFGV
jgi:hypothetical protein